MNTYLLYKLIRPYLKLAFSWRFIVLTILLLFALGWYVVATISSLSWLNVSASSLPLPVYAFWLFILILSAAFSFLTSPAESKLYKAINSSLSNLKVFEAERLMQQVNSYLFLLPSAKIKLGRLQVSLYKNRGELVKAYNLLQILQTFPLLPKEHKGLQIDLARLFYDSGNLKATQQMLLQLKEKQLTKTQKNQCNIQQAELYICSNQLQEAKNLLETDYSKPCLKSSERVAILHTLAVVETHLQNYQGALTAYRQAWKIEKTLTNSFAQAEITIDNLVITYAKQDEASKIHPLIEKLEQLADPSCVEHLLAISNIKMNLARQLGNRQALPGIYKEAHEKLLLKLSGERKFHYIINSLRMHWNDGIAFEDALKKAQEAMLHRPEISTLDTLRSIKEVAGTIQQVMHKTGQRPDLMIFYSWLVLEFKRLEADIDRLLDEVPPNLPNHKAELISLKIENIKNSIFYQPPSKLMFDRLFELLVEKKSLWQGMNNPVDHLNELLIILDEYQAYKKQIANPQFENDFKQFALDTLEEAEQLVADKKQHLAYNEKLIGLVHVCYQLDTKKEQAKKWLDTFDSSKQSLNHNAVWLREQYLQTKSWVINSH